jgi:GntR family transcriptional regulator
MHLPIEIDKTSPLPIYIQLQHGIEDLIKSGELSPGDPLPSENELSRDYRISHMTVRHAMTELVNDGYIHRERGRGTFVSPKRMQHQLETFVSFSESMRQRQVKPSSKVLRIDDAAPPDEVLDTLDLPPGAAFTRIKRLRLANGVPVGIHDAYLHNILVDAAHLERIGSLYTLFEERGIVLNEGEEIIEAVPAEEVPAALLNVRVGFPLLQATRFSWDVTGNFVEYVVALYHADLYRYKIRLKR